MFDLCVGDRAYSGDCGRFLSGFDFMVGVLYIGLRVRLGVTV